MKRSRIFVFICLVILLFAGIFYVFKSKITPLFISEETNISQEEIKNKMSLPKGNYLFNVVSNTGKIVRFVEGQINPPDVHVGDKQEFKVIIASPNKVTSVVAHIDTDNGKIQIPLKQKGIAYAGELSVPRYTVEENGKLKVFTEIEIAELEAKKKKGIFPFVNAENDPVINEMWTGEWIVKDTHDAVYHTKFVALDEKGNSGELVIAWSDACGIPIGGDWNLASYGNCTISSLDGVDNGNVTVSTHTLTLNAKFVFNDGKSISFANGGSVVVGTGGGFEKANLYMTDSDTDGYPSGSTQSTSTFSGARRRYLLNSYNSDCNDANVSLYQNLTGYTDSDGDTYTVGGSQQICSGAALPSGYRASANGNDCNDASVSLYRSVAGYLDSDGDGYGTGSYTTCAGASGTYVANNTDCNDASVSLYQNLTGYTDSDGDTYTVGGSQQICSGASLPSGYRASASGYTDCNDGNAILHSAMYAAAVDADRDGYYLGTPGYLCMTGSVYMAGGRVYYSTDNSNYIYLDTNGGGTTGDCNDANSSIYSGTVQYQGCTVYNECSNSCSGSQSNTCQSNGSYSAWGACGGCTPAPCCTNGYKDYDKDGYGTGAYGCYAPDAAYNVVGNNSDCNDASSNIYQTVSNTVSDSDHDGYRVENWLFSSACVGGAQSFNGRTYYLGQGGAYELTQSWIGDYDCNDSIATKWRIRYADADGDGYGAVSGTCVGNDSGYVDNNLDCNDSYSSISPAASYQSSERPGGGWDWNCDGLVTDSSGFGGTRHQIASSWGSWYGNGPSSCYYGSTLIGCSQGSTYLLCGSVSSTNYCDPQPYFSVYASQSDCLNNIPQTTIMTGSNGVGTFWCK